MDVETYHILISLSVCICNNWMTLQYDTGLSQTLSGGDSKCSKCSLHFLMKYLCKNRVTHTWYAAIDLKNWVFSIPIFKSHVKHFYFLLVRPTVYLHMLTFHITRNYKVLYCTDDIISIDSDDQEVVMYLGI